MQALDFILEREDLDRALGPVVLPANDEIAFLRVMPVHAEIAAFKLEFDADTLPYLWACLADCCNRREKMEWVGKLSGMGG